LSCCGTPGKSQFGYYVNSGKATLDGAAYADKYGLWNDKTVVKNGKTVTIRGNKAKVPVSNGIIGFTGDGTPTSWLNIYRSNTNFVHGSPGNAP
jgi:hypothetical protein